MSDNTKLWDEVCRTDPAHTKAFSKAGGFKGTAVKPFYLMRKATETFGPCGLGWGWEEIENKMVAGVWCSKVRLWYAAPTSEINPSGRSGHIEQWGQTVMEGTNKNGAFVDEEAPKKAVTDAVTKCLSYLGFAGDVHMGLFDDSKYVEGLVEEKRKEESAATRNERYQFIKDCIIGVETITELQNVWTNHLAEINSFKKQDETYYEDLVRVKDDRKVELAHEASFSPGFNNIK